MQHNHYDVLVDNILRRCDVVDAARAEQRPADLVQPDPQRSRRSAAPDFVLVLLVLLLPVSWLHSWTVLGVNAAVLVAFVISVYWRAVAWALAAMGPPDKPQVIAVIKAPDRMFCPKCGMAKTDRYCSGCGANVEKEYRKLVRQLVQYVVQDTEGQRNYLKEAMSDQRGCPLPPLA